MKYAFGTYNLSPLKIKNYTCGMANLPFEIALPGLFFFFFSFFQDYPIL